MKSRFRCTVIPGIVVLLMASVPAPCQIPAEDVVRIEQAAPARATVHPKQLRKLLVFNLSAGFRHTAIPLAGKTLEILGRKTGAFEVVQSSDMSVFTPEQLRRFDAICFNNTTELTFDDPVHRKSLLDFISGGKGIVGLHAAIDNFYTWPEGQALFGGCFDGHPWTGDGTWAVKIEDPGHPLNAAFQGKGFVIHDEIYRVKQVGLRINSRVLIGLDMKNEHNRSALDVRPADRDIPISWIRTYGAGRLFYCSLGHNDEVYWNPAVLQHYLSGIQYALGDLAVDASPVAFDPMSFFDRDSLKLFLQRIAAYRNGESREPMIDFDAFVRRVGDLAEARSSIEMQMLAVLKGSASPEGKQFICQRLAQLGGDESVPALAVMLGDAATFDMALYALGAIPGDRADDALVMALPKVSGKMLIGLINMLGSKQVERSIADLRGFLGNADSPIAAAAASALGGIGAGASLDALMSAKDASSGILRRSIQEAVLDCAGRMYERGDKGAALVAFKSLNVPGVPMPIRCAALRAVILGDVAGAAETVASALRGGDPALQTAAVQSVREMPTNETVRAIARTYLQLPVPGRIQLIAALAQHRDPAVLETVMGTLGDKSPEVRTAALKALRTLGDARSVRLLAFTAANARGMEQMEARISLNGLSAPGVDDSIVALLSSAKAPVKRELIRAIRERRVPATAPALLRAAGDPSDQVRGDAASALKYLVSEEHLPAIVDLLIREKSDACRRELEIAAVAAARKIADPAKQDALLLAAIPGAKGPNARLALIRVLGKVGANNSLSFLRSVLQESDRESRLAAVRALSEWPTSAAFADLWNIATGAADKAQRVIALRGAVRVMGFDTTSSAAAMEKQYRDALALAGNVEERKVLLALVGQARSLAAFRIASMYLSDKDLQQEAEVALVECAEGIAGRAGREIAPPLETVLLKSKSDSLKSRAQKILNAMPIVK
jgi:hypothetical protein